MGRGASRGGSGRELFRAVRAGDSDAAASSLRRAPSAVHSTTFFQRQSPLHIAASNGRLEVLSMILDKSVDPDSLNRLLELCWSKSPLMLAVMHGQIACSQKLLQAGANILLFDSSHARTCLHYAAYYGHLDCLRAILMAARLSSVADSWGFTRFVNVRDGSGATPLHLAARLGRPECVRILLDSGALVCALTDGYSYPGSTPLHLAARKGCLDCVRILLAWGADRKQKDSSGRIPYAVALKRKHGACAALLNPSSADPLVWPSPLKCIRELNLDAKTLLEKALIDANGKREKNILKGTAYSLPSPIHSDAGIDVCADDDSETSDVELCCICFDQACTIEVRDCGHRMCAYCTLSLCCHCKPNPVTSHLPAPSCPFCRSLIAHLVVADVKNNAEGDENFLRARISKRTRNLNEGSSSLKGLSSAISSFGRISGRGKLKVDDSGCSVTDKL